MIDLCHQCPLYTPGLKNYVPPEGPIDSSLMFIGEAPGEEELKLGRPFVGKSGQEHDQYNKRNKIYRARTRISNVLKCHPPKNADPTAEEISLCHQNLLSEIRETSPRVIGAIGRFAAQWFLGSCVMELVHGIPYKVTSLPNGDEIPPVIVVPLYHPSYGLHDTKNMTFIAQDYETLAQVYHKRLKPREFGKYSTKERNYERVKDIGHLERLLKGKTLIALDTESLDFDSPDPIPWSVQFSLEYGSAYMILYGQESRHLIDCIGKFIKDPRVITLLHNAPYDIPVLSSMGLYPANVRDTMQAAYNLQDEPKGLKSLAYRILNMKMQDYGEVVGVAQESKSLSYLLEISERSWPDPEQVLERKKNGEYHIKQPQNIGKKVKRILNDYEKNPNLDLWARWHNIKKNEGRGDVESVCGSMPRANLSDIPFKDALIYACRDADATIGIYPYLMHKIRERGLIRAFKIDVAMLPVVADMRQTGMKIDVKFLHNLSDKFDTLMEDKRIEIEQTLFEHTGERRFINPGSPPQVAQLLFDMDVTRSRKTSTDAKTLDKIRNKHKIVNMITNYREYSKLKGTYSEVLPLKVGIDGRLHSNISATTTTTGRLSSSDPNLQNIPIRTELGREIKKAFVAEPGCLILSADYAQIEMRMACHMSGDPTMAEIFNEGRDIHSETAAWIFKVPLDEVDEMTQRYPTKRTGFGILYAIGPSGLQDQLLKDGLDYTEEYCEFLIRSWFERYHYIREYMDRVISDARIHGRVWDLFGRYRLIPEIYSTHSWIRSAGERQAQNAPIQGGAQEIIKIAMGEIRDIYLEWQAQGYRCHPINQVHDDFMFEVSEEIWEEFAEIQKVIMESAVSLNVPVVVDQKVGRSWGEMEKIKQ